jgi:tRNA(fMet)-specific endonuclease VapC
MTRFLLDSSFCIACLRRKPWALQVLGSVPLASVAVSSLTVGEMVLGANLSDHPSRELANVEAFLRPIQVLPFGRDEAFQRAGIEAQLRKQGNRIEAEDAMIAATALALGMILVSGNTKHFGRVKGLKIVDWEQHPPKA